MGAQLVQLQHLAAVAGGHQRGGERRQG
jgi:hypothetical protein